MLINRTGTRLFSEYNLSDNLRNFISNIKKSIESDKSIFERDEQDYVKEKLAEHRAKPILLHVDQISLSQEEVEIPGRYFPFGYDVERHESFPKPVVTFRLPFEGNEDWLKCRPSTFLMWSDEVEIFGNIIKFEIINFNNNADEMKKKRDEFLKNLQTQVSNINKDLDGYNSKLETVIRESIAIARKKFKEQDEFLSKLK